MDRDTDNFSQHVSLANPLAAITITCGVGDRRQIQMAINVSCADPIDLQNEMLDRAMRLLDRQQARYDLEKEEENFKLVGLNTRNALLAIEAAETTAQTQTERLRIELQAKEDARKEIHDAAYAAHTSSDRRGDFVPKGHTLQRLNVADMEISKTRAAIEAAPADAAQHRAQIVGSIQRNQEDMRIRRKRINELRGIAGLPLNDDFMDAETAQV